MTKVRFSKSIFYCQKSVQSFWIFLFFLLKLDFWIVLLLLSIFERVCFLKLYLIFMKSYKNELKINQNTILPTHSNLYSVVSAKLCSKSVVMLWNINQTFQSAHGAVPYVKKRIMQPSRTFAMITPLIRYLW